MSKKTFTSFNEGIVRIRRDEGSQGLFYAALVRIADLANMPVQYLYEAWLTQVINGMTQDEIELDLLEMAQDMTEE